MEILILLYLYLIKIIQIEINKAELEDQNKKLIKEELAKEVPKLVGESPEHYHSRLLARDKYRQRGSAYQKEKRQNLEIERLNRMENFMVKEKLAFESTDPNLNEFQKQKWETHKTRLKVMEETRRLKLKENAEEYSNRIDDIIENRRKENIQYKTKSTSKNFMNKNQEYIQYMEELHMKVPKFRFETEGSSRTRLSISNPDLFNKLKAKEAELSEE
jgi:hypothetical protein